MDMNELMNRRSFLSRLNLLLVAATGAVLSVPILSYLLSPIVRPARQVWRTVGKVDDFPMGQTVRVAIEDPSPLPWAGQTARTAAWLRRTGPSDFIAFAVNCTHLGCPVNWVAEANIFLCPCHGGVYYADGRVAGGPPPRPLYRYDVRVQNGQVQLLTRALPVG